MAGQEAVLDARLPLQRYRLLVKLDRWLETPLLALSGIWLYIMVRELTGEVGPVLGRAGLAIWLVFVADFALKLLLAPAKGLFLKRNVVVLLSLALPALRLLRILRLARALRLVRATRGLRLVRVLASVNRGLRTLSRLLRRRGFGYVLSSTVLVVLLGAAGMLAFERDAEPRGLEGYPEALWWTAMIVTTMGSEYWPRSPEGRFLCLLLAVYGFTVFGYVTAALASFFVSQDRGPAGR